MSDQQKLSERMRELSASDTVDEWSDSVEALETQLAEAIRERDDARAETKIRTESLHTAVRLKLQAQSQRDALAKHESCDVETNAIVGGALEAFNQMRAESYALEKVLRELVECVDDLVNGFSPAVDPRRWVIQATQPARELLAALDRTAPADGGRKGK